MAKYKIEIKRSAIKELYKLPKTVLPRILQKIDLLTENPRPQNCVKLSGQEKYRIRVGNYRILYSIFDNKLVIFVVKIAHRKNVYK